MNIFMYTNRFGVYMAGKLYWRVKKDGKWTWVAFTKDNSKMSFETPSGWIYSNDGGEKK